MNEINNIKKQFKDNISKLIEHRQLEQAKDLINQYENIVHDDIEIYSMKAIIAILENRFDDAESILKEGLDIDSNNFDLNYNLGYLYEKKGSFNHSIEYYKKAFDNCKDETLKADISSIIEKISTKNIIKPMINKNKIAFFVKQGMDSFLGDIINELSGEYETKKIVVTNYSQIDEGMEWADICWFEWCDELVIYGSKLNLAKNKKIICRIHGYEVYTDYIKQVAWGNVDDLIIVAPHIRRIFEENTKNIDMGNLRIHTIFCGINTDKYPLNVKSKGFNLGYLGYINFKKNIPLTLDIFKKLHDMDSRYKLHLAGEFQDARTLSYFKYFIKEHNLSKSVFFYGWQNEKGKIQWLKKIDYMIISSIDEGLCFAAAEAMCSGIKPILHNCEGIKDHYDKKYIFNTIDEAVNMITSSEYNSQEYRKFIVKNYSLKNEIEYIRPILKILFQDIDKNKTQIINDVNTFDLTYAQRYKERNDRKVKAILKNIDKYNNAIDIGCNQGYLILNLLNKGYIKKGYGIDLDKSVLSKELISNDDFKFYEQDIVNYEFKDCYDLVIYNAVHHHVFGKYGKQRAFQLFSDVIDHCNETLIFETGMISEEGDYYWKDEIIKYFDNDQMHFNKLWQLIGPRLKNIEIIDELDIHGTKRPIFKISLYPINSDYNLKKNIKKFYEGKLIKDNNLLVLKQYRRTIGSLNQKLVELPNKNNETLYDETVFYKLKDKNNGNIIFGKKIENDVYKQMREFTILNQVKHPKAIKLLGVSEKYGLLFPYLQWQNLDEVDFSRIKNINIFKKEIDEFFNYVNNTYIDMDVLDFENSLGKKRKLIDVVDFHAHNFCINVQNDFIKNWAVLDFEYYSNNNCERNIINKTNIDKLVSAF